MDRKIIRYQQDVLKALSGRIDDMYLAGGTALSLFYFQHRLSVDLDFFTRSFDYQNIAKTIEYLEIALNKKIEVVDQRLEKNTARMVTYNIYFNAKNALKVDFVEDTVDLLKKTKAVDGIRVLSLEDIYLRKIYALAGMVKTVDGAGRERFIGGRSDAKDFYDLYYLSTTFMPFSKFLRLYCDRTMMEAIIRWYRTFDRMAIMDGILNLATDKPVDYKAQERHFKTEIDRVIEIELGGL